MTAELQSVMDAALRLSDRDRAALVARLVDTLSDGVETDEFDEAFFDELDQRMAEGLQATEPWADVRDRP